MSLDEVAARRVIGELARELGLSDREAAEGVLTMVNANMANAISSRTVQKGIDPRDYALVAFGGAGTAARRRSGRHARHPRGDRAAPSRHHLGGRTFDQRPAIRRHPHLVPGLRRGRPFAHQRRLRGDGQGTGRPLHRRRHRARRASASSAAAICAMSARATSCACPSPTARSTRRRSPRPSTPSTRSIAASTAMSSPIGRSRSSTCGWSAPPAPPPSPSRRSAPPTSLEAAKVRTGTCTFRVGAKLADYADDLLSPRSAAGRRAHRRPGDRAADRTRRPSCRRTMASTPTRRAI